MQVGLIVALAGAGLRFSYMMIPCPAHPFHTRTSGRILPILSIVIVVPGLILAAWFIVHLLEEMPNGNRLQAALFQTAPVRTDHAGVDRIYFVSTQSETIVLIA